MNPNCNIYRISPCSNMEQRILGSESRNLAKNLCNMTSPTNMGSVQFPVSERPASAIVDPGDWRAHLEPGFRNNTLRTIMKGLLRLFPNDRDEATMMRFNRFSWNIEAKFYRNGDSLDAYHSKVALLMPFIVAVHKARNRARQPFDKCPVSASSTGNASSDDHKEHHSENHMCLSGNLKDEETGHGIGEPPTTQELVPSQAVTTQDPPFQRLIQALKRSSSIQPPVQEQLNPPRTTGSDDILLEEINKINNLLVDTVVEISKQGTHEGTVVYCCFKPVSLCQNLKPLCELAPFQPIRLLIPESYPNQSPLWHEDFPVEAGSGFCNEASVKARSRFGLALRVLSEPMSISKIASAWDFCAREAISEFAQQYGGGTFSNKYGDWSCCLAPAGSRSHLVGI